VNDLYVSTDAKLLTYIVINWAVHCSATCAEKITTRLDVFFLYCVRFRNFYCLD